MSEPVTHAEIEDVLSSIRRLVSEDGRESSVSGMPAPAAKPAARLVLTPSLRVADVEPESETTEAEDVADSDPDTVQSSQPEPQADNVPNAPVSEIHESEPDSAQEDAPPVRLFPADQDTLAAAEPTVDLDAKDLGLEPSVQGGDTVLPSAELDVEESPAESAPWSNPATTLFAAAGVINEDPSNETSTEDKAASEPKSTASFADKIAALEAAIGQTDEQWEPDGEPGEANAATSVETLAWEDIEDEQDVEAEVSTADDVVDMNPQADVTAEFISSEPDPLDAAQLAEDAIADEVLGEVGADESVMDEESLRELVADIVREELQGALGERITRNVRKLVRREIQRALAVQDLG